MPDINLNGERSDAVADILIERGIPFTFSTGYARSDLLDMYAACPVLTKPTQFAELGAIMNDLLS